MKQLFDDICFTTKQDVLTPSLHLCKLMEEVGELAQVINKDIGRKRKKETDSSTNIIENIKEEIADSIQVLFSIATCYGFSYEELMEELEFKNLTYRDELLTRKNNL